MKHQLVARLVSNRLAHGVVRYDLDAGRDETLVFGPDRFGGEAVFAPRAGGSAEDDGWLLSLVHDQGEGSALPSAKAGGGMGEVYRARDGKPTPTSW